MSKDNQSRHYFMSNQNMSDIKQSIAEQSMNFGQGSNRHGNSREEISEMISGSHQVTQSRVPKSKSMAKDTNAPKDPQRTSVPVPEHIDNEYGVEINLGDNVYRTIKERYYETNKIETNDVNVLYEYYLLQRRNANVNGMKPITREQIQKQMPMMQRKLLVKQQFQNILRERPVDVYYTLCIAHETLKKDRKMQLNMQIMNRQAQNNKKKLSSKEAKEVFEKLYNTGRNFNTRPKQLTPQQQQKIERTKFGNKLSEYFQNAYRQKGEPENIETLDKLYKYFQSANDREEYDIEWDEKTAKMTIQRYMCEQIQDLLTFGEKKLGFKCGKAASLFQLYLDHRDKMPNISIPINSFKQYARVYNEVEKRKVLEDMNKTKQNVDKSEQIRKKSEVKKFGRPVSATPISILAQPKKEIAYIESIASKYPTNKLIKTLLTQNQIKKPRHPLEYGVYDIEQQAKIKQWVKIDPKKPEEKYDEKISQQLVQTFLGGSNFFKPEDEDDDQVMSILREQNLHKPDTWKQLGPIFQQAMLVKAHEHGWFRDCMIRYVQRVIPKENFKLQTNQVVFKRLFGYLNELSEDEKLNQFQKLETLILTSQNIADKAKRIQALANGTSAKEKNKQKREVQVFMEDKAKQYVKMRIKKKNDNFSLREYLNKLFEQLAKQHKNYVVKTFNVVTGQKQCPRLLKYQFFRVVKEINPITLERQRIAKNPAWVPTNNDPAKTYNHFADFYMKDKFSFPSTENPKYKNTLWGRGKGSDRENLMMTYDDARECTFQPKISKKIV